MRKGGQISKKEFLLLIICDFSEFVSFFEELHNISLIYE